MHTVAVPVRKRRVRNPEDTAFIYGLVCPHENIVRYVGRTFSPYNRLFGHIAEATNDDTRAWFMSLVAEGRLPHVITLEVTTFKEASRRELAWIRHYHRRHGPRLLNRSGIPASESTVIPRGRRGRPPVADKLVPKAIRLLQSRIPVYEAAAAADGMEWSEWVRDALERAAKRRR
jgi:hypothetical protein